MLKWTLSFASSIAAWRMHYQRTAVSLPKIHYGEHNTDAQSLLPKISALHQHYRPTPWLYNGHLQLVALGIQKTFAAPLQYDHIETLAMDDGGHTELVWLGYNLPADTPTIVILHTVTGTPHSMRAMVKDLHRITGWRVVVCVRRGHTSQPLSSSKLSILGSTADLKVQLECIQQRYPQSSLYAVGSSAGTAVLARYLGEVGNQTPIQAAFAYCPGYNTDVAFDEVVPFYSRAMAKKLIRTFIQPNLQQLAQLQTLAQLQQATTMAEFNHAAYELAGYADLDSYKAAINPAPLFENIQRPVLMLNAEDDPVCHFNNVKPYLTQLHRYPTAIVVTTRRGSHCAHFTGWKPTSWAHQLIADFFMVQHAQHNNVLNIRSSAVTQTVA